MRVLQLFWDKRNIINIIWGCSMSPREHYHNGLCDRVESTSLYLWGFKLENDINLYHTTNSSEKDLKTIHEPGIASDLLHSHMELSSGTLWMSF